MSIGSRVVGRLRFRKVSPALIIPLIALFAALSGGAAAGTTVGNLYVADGTAITEFTPDGAVVSTYTDSRFSQVFDLAFNNTGDVLYATDAIAHDVKLIDASGNVVSTFGANVLSQPRGIAVHETGDIYVADTGAGDIKVFDAAGNYLRSFGAIRSPLNLALSPDGRRLFVSESNYFTGVHLFDLTDSDRYLGTFGETSANVVLTSGLAVAPDGTLYVGDSGFGGGADSIKVFNPDGSYARTLISGLTAPTDLTFDAAGKIWVTNTNDFTGEQILAFDPVGNLVRSFGGAELNQPTGLTFLSPQPDLLAMVQGVGPGTSLNDKVKTIQSYIAEGDKADACTALNAFKHEVSAQTGKKIPADTVAALQHEADRLSESIGC
jgi:sugar lactone lactonase YvrE